MGRFVSGVGSNETQDLGTLFREHQPWLRGWLSKKTGCPQSAADLAQDTYLRLLVSGHLPSPAQSRCHLTQIAKGLMIDLFRRKRLEQAYLNSLIDLPEPEVPSAEMQVLLIERLIEIDALLHKLPHKARTAFLLNRLEGLSYPEIAKRLSVSVSSIEKYIALALISCYRATYEN